MLSQERNIPFRDFSQNINIIKWDFNLSRHRIFGFLYSVLHLWSAFPNHILKVLGSKLGPEARWSSSSFSPRKCLDSTLKYTAITSPSFASHHSEIILQLKWLINKHIIKKKIWTLELQAIARVLWEVKGNFYL